MKIKTIVFQVDDDLHRDLKIYLAEKEITMKDFFISKARDELKKWKTKK